MIVMTLQCCYMACGDATSDQGVEDVCRYRLRFDPPEFVSSPMPFVVRDGRQLWFREYFIWFYGYVVALPLP